MKLRTMEPWPVTDKFLLDSHAGTIMALPKPQVVGSIPTGGTQVRGHMAHLQPEIVEPHVEPTALR